MPLLISARTIKNPKKTGTGPYLSLLKWYIYHSGLRTLSNVPDQCGITELAEVDSIALSSSSWHSAQRFPRALKIEGSLLLKLMQLKLLKNKGLVIVFSKRIL